MPLVAQAPQQQRYTAHDGILCPHQIIVRRPLAQWAEALADALARLRLRERPSNWSAQQKIIAAFNEAALIEVHFGRLDHATRLCERALQYIALTLHIRGSADAAIHAFQPLINLSRLDRIQGRWTESLQALETVGCALRGESVALGPVRLSGEIVGDLLGNDEHRFVLFNMFSIDSLKTLLKAGLYEEAIEFSARQTECATSAAQKLFLTEGAVVALCRCGRADTALRLATAAVQVPQLTQRLVFMLRRAEALLINDEADSRDAVIEAVNLAASIREPSWWQLAPLAPLADLTHAAGQPSLAASIVDHGYAGACRLADVLWQMSFLKIRRTLNIGDPVATSQALDRIRRVDAYGLAATCPADHPAQVAVDRLFEFLMADAIFDHVTRA